MNYKTEQENFWAGEFGQSYIDQKLESILYAKVALWVRMLRAAHNIKSIESLDVILV